MFLTGSQKKLGCCPDVDDLKPSTRDSILIPHVYIYIYIYTYIYDVFNYVYILNIILASFLHHIDIIHTSYIRPLAHRAAK